MTTERHGARWWTGPVGSGPEPHATASFPGRTGRGGSRGLDDHLVRDLGHGAGAGIRGRNAFGPQRGPGPITRGWAGGGDEPPFRTPVFVLTHHPRPSSALGDTTFHVVDGTPVEVLGRARAAADGHDVRLGGGDDSIRALLGADLVDALHVAVSPVQMGGGSRLRESPEELDDRFHHDVVPSPSGVTPA